MFICRFRPHRKDIVVINEEGRISAALRYSSANNIIAVLTGRGLSNAAHHYESTAAQCHSEQFLLIDVYSECNAVPEDRRIRHSYHYRILVLDTV